MGGESFGMLKIIRAALKTIRTEVVIRRKGAIAICTPRSIIAIIVPATVMLLPISTMPIEVRFQSCKISSPCEI